MFLVNAAYLDQDFRPVRGDLEIEGGRIRQVGEKLSWSQNDLVVDCQGYTIVPGFVDVHIHGCVGADTCDGKRESIDAMAEFLLTKGVTSFCPTTMTVDRAEIEAALLAAKACVDQPGPGARVVGVNMEGPFIAAARKGAQKEEAILPPDPELFRHFQELSGGIVRLVDIAPEQPGGLAFIREVKDLCAVSIAHTTANYDQAKESFDAGITHATHLFNAMSGLHHRDPGVVGAVFDDSRVYAELICDGFHIHPAALRTAFQVLGDRALVISDSMRANGMPEGEPFDLGGQMVTVREGKATLANGTIAGSVSNLHQEVKNLVRFGIPLEQAVKAASLIPARSIGLEEEIGSIAPGKRADLVVLDENLDIVAVYHENQ
ncbi:MAG TPA: N-acetylglucosamine-6-phosphate deacetylase [Candidatus Acutalibacter pullistercoris]|uniref:N-acetylglucosamine-6-phosphate deacetylase n=1 Tax=Candidatus Acutalibacter pullistercoris TaxID=2838418 RepID=A0A9D2C0Z1_9FIRM|nr:N-acetylglucosamine-6-phosphate deacetylase [Candidatus Acutalibacter pullistercoris]